MYGKCRDQGIVGTDEDPFAGWMSDPYDEDWKKGVLMNVSELEEFDQFFPGFPLTLCREFIGALIDGSGQPGDHTQGKWESGQYGVIY